MQGISTQKGRQSVSKCSFSHNSKMGTSGCTHPRFRALVYTLFMIVLFSELSGVYSSPVVYPGGDVPFYQQFCQRRRPVQCCPGNDQTGRDDGCHMPIAGQLCYCDIFCNRTKFDCCPDFWRVCFDTTPPPIALTIPPRKHHNLYCVDGIQAFYLRKRFRVNHIDLT